MSKYNARDKFIIQIGRKITDDFGSKYLIKGISNLVLYDTDLDRLERYDTDEKANANYNTGYKEGLNDAWECAKKIVMKINNGGLRPDELMRIFGTYDTDRILIQYSPSEATDKIRRCELECEELKPGDEVFFKNRKDIEEVAIVTKLQDKSCAFLCADGSVGICYKKELVKTGKHHEIIEDLLSTIKTRNKESCER